MLFLDLLENGVSVEECMEVLSACTVKNGVEGGVTDGVKSAPEVTPRAPSRSARERDASSRAAARRSVSSCGRTRGDTRP